MNHKTATKNAPALVDFNGKFQNIFRKEITKTLEELFQRKRREKEERYVHQHFLSSLTLIQPTKT